MKRIQMIFLAIVLLLSHSVYAHKSIDVHSIWKQLPTGAQASFVLFDPEAQRVLVHQQEQRLMVPASLQKIVTSLAALAWLGPDFQYRTQLAVSQPPKNNQITGDLWVRFSGDPTLTTQDLDQLFYQLSKHNIHRIQGNIWLDNRVFNRYPLGEGWAWDDAAACYSAPVSAISLNGNCFGARFRPQSGGQKVRVVPNISGPSIHLASDITIQTHSANAPAHCDLEVTTRANNRYRFYGCITSRQVSYPLNLALINPEPYAVAQIKASLARYHIRYSGQVAISAHAEVKTPYVLAEQRSVALTDLVHTLLKESDNHITDSLLKTLGHRYYRVAGNFTNGSDAVHAILKKVAGIDLERSLMVDGSGLSRYNLIAPEDLLKLLNWANQSFRYGELFTSALPIAGVDGTLQYRFGTDHTLDGLVYAKTGSFGGVRNLAGFIRTKKHKTLIFVLMTQGYVSSISSDVDAMKKFESTLLHAIYHAG